MLIHRIPALVLGLAALVPSAIAQTRAAYTVVPGCNQSLPPDSLRTRLPSTPLIVPDANHVFVFEVESTPLTSQWRAETLRTGFSGASYYRWNGPDYFSSSGNGVLTWQLDVAQAGRYGVVLHNRHDHSDSSLENDCWMRVNGSSWTKVYSNVNRNSGIWNWHTRFDPGHTEVQYDLVAGINTLEISARSYNFMMDRLHVFPWARTGMETLSIPLSTLSRERPVLGTTIHLQIGDPRNAAALPAIGVQSWLLAGIGTSTPCGVMLPSFGATGGAGEFLLGLSPAPVSFPASGYGGPANPSSVALSIPNHSALTGAVVSFQGLLVSGGAQLRTVLTERLDLRVGVR